MNIKCRRRQPPRRRTAIATLAFAMCVTALGAQDDLPDELPHNAVRTVLDLVRTVEDLIRVAETPEEIRIELAADVLFDFDSAAIKPAALPSLERAAGIIREEAQGDVRVEGHTDAKGADDYKQSLSEDRAEAVRDWLASDGGLNETVFVTAGFGETTPVVPNEKNDGSDHPIARQRDRRVEIIITKVG